MFYKRFKKFKGFTLLEIMIVIAIMAVLLSVVLPAMQRGRDQGKLSACMANLKNVATMTEVYMMDNRNMAPVDLNKLIAGEYLKTIPPEPAGGVYGYESEITFHNNYTIYCKALGRPTHGVLGVPSNYPAYCPIGGQTDGIKVR